MSTPLEDYQAFIDGLVRLSTSVSVRWVREGTGWPELPENQVINEFVISLPGHQRGVLAILLEGAFKEGAHQVLAYMIEMIDLKQLRLTQRGRELPVAPFGTELHYDWACRLADDDWPESTE